MTEIEWDSATDPEPMLRYLHGRISERELRLFAVACCRRIEHLIMDSSSRESVNVAERFARNEVSPETLEAAGRVAKAAYQVAKERVLTSGAPTHRRDLMTEGAALIAEGVAQACLVVADVQFGIANAAIVTYCTAEAKCGVRPPNDESAAQSRLLREMIPYSHPG